MAAGRSVVVGSFKLVPEVAVEEENGKKKNPYERALLRDEAMLSPEMREEFHKLLGAIDAKIEDRKGEFLTRSSSTMVELAKRS